MRRDLSLKVLTFILITNVYLNLFISTKFIGSILIILISINSGFEKSKIAKAIVAIILLSLPSIFYVSNYISFFGEILLFYSGILFYSSKVFVRCNILLFARNMLELSAFFASIIVVKFVVTGSWNGNVIEFGELFITFNPIPALAVLPIVRKEFPNDARLKIAQLVLLIFVFCSDWRAVQLAIVVMMFYDYSKKYRMFKYSLFIGIVICLLGSVKYVKENKPLINGVLAINNDVTSGRAYLWTKAIKTYANEFSLYKKVFGCGFGQFSSEINKYELSRLNIDWQDLHLTSYNKKTSDSRVHAHNWFVNLLYENGLMGCVYYVGLIFGAIRVYKISKMQRFNTVILSSFLFLFVVGLFNSVLYIQSIYLYFILIFAKYYVQNYRDIRLSSIR